MDDPILTDIEVASAAVVNQATYDFANALSETPQFQAFERAAWHLRQDEQTQAALKAFRDKQDSLKALAMLKAVSSKDQAELDGLRQNLFSLPSMVAYTQAQTDLASLCQTAGDLLSKSIGIDFSAATSSGCC
ncbi:MAG: YlbF family regulator [Anaerolineaceae bacterium]|nr:YlbF family regulator [Anaerolineaceae bacterium]